VLVTVIDVLMPPGQVVLGLVVMAPLVAATTLGRRATLGYGVAAFVTAALLGVYDEQYSGEALPAQLVRLTAVILGSGAALAACTMRLRREEQLARLGAETAAARAAVQIAETLQRNLLGEPQRVPGLETAVRYLPATRHAQVGGDWYDAFPIPGGSTMLVIGDVAGHDAPAAATMSQYRGMLRAIAQSVVGSPAAVLAALDTASATLGLRTLVTAAVATVDVGQDGDDDGVTLRWSNAGHPAPVLICADGAAVLLERPPDRLLGVSPATVRRDHRVTLRPGDTVVFYTDGLVEQPGVFLDDGTARIVEKLGRIGREPLDQLCDHLVAGMTGPIADDVALLAVRIPLRR
jgi:serine phosphatase RsbU (regulator of sigma subunit)